MSTSEADMTRRYDYAVFSDDRFVTNALLTQDEVARMELDGMRCLRVTDTIGETLPRFRGRRSVKSPVKDSRRWDR